MLYEVITAGDVIEIREQSKQMALLLEAVESGERDVPDYFDVDHKAMKGTFIRIVITSYSIHYTKLYEALGRTDHRVSCRFAACLDFAIGAHTPP